MTRGNPWWRMHPVAYIGWAFLLFLVVAPTVWWFSMRASLAPLAETGAEDLYQALKMGDYERIEEDGLAANHSVSALRKCEQKIGPVESFEIDRLTYNVFVIPIVVSVKTVRDGVEYEEVVIMHGSEGGYLQWSIRDYELSNTISEEIWREAQNQEQESE